MACEETVGAVRSVTWGGRPYRDLGSTGLVASGFVLCPAGGSRVGEGPLLPAPRAAQDTQDTGSTVGVLWCAEPDPGGWLEATTVPRPKPSFRAQVPWPSASGCSPALPSFARLSSGLFCLLYLIIL